MSLPPGFLEELHSRVPVSRIVGRKVTWDQRRSHPGKGDYWAPCPFHQEKTASFHVDDRKGFYYCFGCHEKGDAIAFLKATENLTFIEAVEVMAREAGMPMPAPDPRRREAEDRRATLSDLVEQAVQFYRLQLKTNTAAGARDYLDRRGLDEATRARFELGFAPPANDALIRQLTGKGTAVDKLIEAGLAVRPDDGRAPYDRFRNRIMFPIRDPRGRAIAFGARALDPNERAKYLNSNETALFDKGRTVYNLGPAREAARKTGRVIVVEGYMDVVALAQAGFDDAVAPLGTAITEDQLRRIWSAADEPVVALDGDEAGQRAALRLAELALPLLEPGKSLRFATLPPKMDPDDVIRDGGAAAMARHLDEARPMLSLLWQQLIEGKVFDSPERGAALDRDLRDMLGRIADPSVKAHYRAAVQTLRRELFAPARPAGQGSRAARTGPADRATTPGRGGRFRGQSRFAPPPLPLAETRASALARAGDAPQILSRPRESLILFACLRFPRILHEMDSELEGLRFFCPDLAELRDLLLSVAATFLDSDSLSAESLSSALAARLGHDPAERLRDTALVRLHRLNGPDADAALALVTAREEIAKQAAAIGLEAELREAGEELMGLADEGVTWRLAEARRAVDDAARAALGDEDDDDASDRARSKALQTMIDQQVWLKKKK